CRTTDACRRGIDLRCLCVGHGISLQQKNLDELVRAAHEWHQPGHDRQPDLPDRHRQLYTGRLFFCRVWQKSALHLYHGLHPVADHFHDPCRGYVILWMDVPVRLWQFCRAQVRIAAHRLVVDAHELAYRLRPGPQTDLYTGVVRGEYGAQVLSPMKATSVWGSPDADSDLGCTSFQDSGETLR